MKRFLEWIRSRETQTLLVILLILILAVTGLVDTLMAGTFLLAILLWGFIRPESLEMLKGFGFEARVREVTKKATDEAKEAIDEAAREAIQQVEDTVRILTEFSNALSGSNVSYQYLCERSRANPNDTFLHNLVTGIEEKYPSLQEQIIDLPEDIQTTLRAFDEAKTTIEKKALASHLRLLVPKENDTSTIHLLEEALIRFNREDNIGVKDELINVWCACLHHVRPEVREKLYEALNIPSS